MTEMDTGMTNAPTMGSKGSPVRLHYLDWLRVLAILGVFFFHAGRPFDFVPWEINNSEQSLFATAVFVFFLPWGMPLFFFLSGAGTWFALRRRTARQYAIERVQRLLIPYIVGCLLLTPIQLYFQWLHAVQVGAFSGTFWEGIQTRTIQIGPRFFGWAGYHLWFLGFLFAFSLMALPLFLWLKSDAGQRLVDRLAKLGERRGCLLLFIIPLVVVKLVLQPHFPDYQDWADFVYMLTFFVYGYLLFADERFVPAVRRSWSLMLALGVVSSVLIFVGGATGVIYQWLDARYSPGYLLYWTVWGINGWCWTLFVLYTGMRWLDFANERLVYGRETILPFYLLHQPVIFVIAFFVVQWDTGTTLKYSVVIVSSLLATLGLAELVKRITVLRPLLGMKPR
jgi:peptidoglycan/LPS O-acetylase OafA/YrhL